ncbi:MAG: hypothetical protein ACREPB_06030 [Arenimonas sp.]
MNIPMTPQEIERELLRQEKAEQREQIHSDTHDDAVIDQYRLLHRLLKRSDVPALPSNFAYQVAQQVEDFEERPQFENMTLRVTIVIMVMAGLFFAAPALVAAMQSMLRETTLPWPMLCAATLALAFAAAIDKASNLYRTR